ncbi:MAG: hypothetical protein ACRDOL_37760 [Streptosporangiaceae bacterium]
MKLPVDACQHVHGGEHSGLPRLAGSSVRADDEMHGPAERGVVPADLDCPLVAFSVKTSARLLI